MSCCWAFCQELGIRSVLTTQVINWARSSVRECDRARRLVHYAVRNRVLPKHLETGLVMLRDAKLYEQGPEHLARLAEQVRDNNYRLLAENGQLHLIGAKLLLQDTDPFLLFDRLLKTSPTNMDPSHAFYLGYELCKATTALTLGKQYHQDEALDWGLLTVPETSHRLRKSCATSPVRGRGLSGGTSLRLRGASCYQGGAGLKTPAVSAPVMLIVRDVRPSCQGRSRQTPRANVRHPRHSTACPA